MTDCTSTQSHPLIEKLGDDESWELFQLLLPDDRALVADIKIKLHPLVTEFCRICDQSDLQVDVGKRKILKCTREDLDGRMEGELNDNVQEEMV